MKNLIDAHLKDGYQLIDSSGKYYLKILLVLSCIGAALDLIGIGVAIPLILSVGFGSFQELIELFPDNFRGYVTPSFLLSIFIIFVILKTAASILIVKYRTNVVYKISSSISSRLVKELIKNPNEFFIYYGSGTASRLGVVECNSFALSFVNPIVSFVSEGVLLISIFAFLFFIDPYFSLMIGVVFLILSLIYRQITKDRVTAASFARVNGDKSRVNLIETFSTLSIEAKDKSQKDWLLEKYMKKNIDSRNASAEYLFWNNLTRPYLETLLYVIVLSMVLFSIISQAISSNNSSSFLESYDVILYFILAAIRCLPGITRLLSAFLSLKYANAAISQLKKAFEDLSKAGQVIGGEYKNHFSKDSMFIEINNYKVALENGFKQNIDNFKFDGPGMFFIDGPSGSGKTTLINHLAGIRSDYTGKITVSSPSNSFEKNNKIKNVSLCPQQVFLLSGSLEENIYLGNEPIEKTNKYLKEIINNLDFKNFLPVRDSLDDIQIDNFGLKLSGGQRQRIALLRGIASRSDIIIFDEPLSSLDIKYRSYILSVFKELSKSKIIILTSHVDIEEIIDVCDSNLHLNKNF